jgi:hypothetical protein
MRLIWRQQFIEDDLVQLPRTLINGLEGKEILRPFLSAAWDSIKV